MGEPYPSQAEMVGFGRILFHAREYWPDYISCVLVVRDDAIANKPEVVQVLVDGIARSGLWLENPPKRLARREHAADFVGRFYFRQDPRLLRWALTKPIDRKVADRVAVRAGGCVRGVNQWAVRSRQQAGEESSRLTFVVGGGFLPTAYCELPTGRP